jgi:hypothetical protein
VFTLGYQLLESRRSVPVLDRGGLTSDLITAKGDNANRPVQLLDRRRPAERSAALRQILTGQTLVSLRLAGQSEANQSHPQLHPSLGSLRKVSPTNDSILFAQLF